MDKEMLCSALRVSRLFFIVQTHFVYWLVSPIAPVMSFYLFIYSYIFFLTLIETDDIPGDTTERRPGCQGGGPETQDQNENIWKVSAVITTIMFRFLSRGTLLIKILTIQQM